MLAIKVLASPFALINLSLRAANEVPLPRGLAPQGMPLLACGFVLLPRQPDRSFLLKIVGQSAFIMKAELITALVGLTFLIWL